jgi:hypothetical protein
VLIFLDIILKLRVVSIFVVVWQTEFVYSLHTCISHPHSTFNLRSTGPMTGILRLHSAYDIEAGCVFFPAIFPLYLHICMYVYVMFEWNLNVSTLCAVIADTLCLPK